MNDDLQIGCDLLARIIDPAYRSDKPHPLTKLLASHAGIAGMVDFVERAERGNASVRRAHRTMRTWTQGGEEIPAESLHSRMLQELVDLRKELEHYKTRDAEHHYWALQTQEDCSAIQAASRLSKEELGRLPKNLTELRKEKL